MYKSILSPVALVLFLVLVSSFGVAQEKTEYREGLRENPPTAVCLINAHIHVPSGVLKGESLLIVDGKISKIGKFDTPAGAKEVDLAGKHLYPGFIDPYVAIESEWERAEGTGYWNDRVTPERPLATSFDLKSIPADKLRKSGFTVAGLVPESGIIRGTGVAALLSEDRQSAVLNPVYGQHAELTVRRRRGSGYPNSPMGAVALARQAFLDAQWYQSAWRVANADVSLPRPENNLSLDALQATLNGDTPLFVTTSNELFVLRADRFAKEFSVPLVIKGSGNEYRRLTEIAALKRELIVPIDFPEPPVVSSPESAIETSLETLLHWDIAPENPARLHQAHVRFSITSEGSEDFLANLRKAVQRGLPRKAALNAITFQPAQLLGIESQAGSIETGKLANLVACSKELWAEDSKVTHTWVAGSLYEFDKKPSFDIEGEWTVESKLLKGHVLTVAGADKASLQKPEKKRGNKKKPTPKQSPETSKEKKKSSKNKNAKKDKKNRGKKDSPTKTEEPDEKKIPLKNIQLNGRRLTATLNSSKIGVDGVSLIRVLFTEDHVGTGFLTRPDGKVETLVLKKGKQGADQQEDKSTEDNKESGKTNQSIAASFPVNFPLGAYGIETPPQRPESVLIKNVTVWTCGEKGILKQGAVLFGAGVIQGVFPAGAKLPKADVVLDGKGQHLTPGIIDCHSHMATDSGVNESGQAITAEVRIGDMVDGDDINIFRQLAGGVTAVNVLHGSANPIGGQNQVIKLRWGQLGEEMKFRHAPAGIKFALGENVKQSNRPNSTTRYPQTRMGVEQIMRDAFEAAIDYRKRHAEWAKSRKGLPPRVDLELEALAEIVDGTRWIHCHSYRQDEILALIRTLDDYKITIGSFQHILEGYKVADAMAKHGATGSAFADWWAYKYEVIDGIPHAGALMHNAGVVVSYNSDDAELGRHLNHEAAKAVRYGGVPEEEALKFVTLNPAKQLRIDDRVGSIEVGKDADLALWSGPPLSNLSRCEQTWVDGRKYFDRGEEAKTRLKNEDMRRTLIQKILMSGEKMKESGGGRFDPAKLWPRYDEFCHGHNHDEDHLHDELEHHHHHE